MLSDLGTASYEAVHVDDVCPLAIVFSRTQVASLAHVGLHAPTVVPKRDQPRFRCLSEGQRRFAAIGYLAHELPRGANQA